MMRRLIWIPNFLRDPNHAELVLKEDLQILLSKSSNSQVPPYLFEKDTHQFYQICTTNDFNWSPNYPTTTAIARIFST